MCKLRYRKLIAIDLFAGAGGLSLGFEMAGYNVAAKIEMDKWACETLRENFKKSVIIESDIEKVSPKHLLAKFGEIDVIIGGPPCQGFSIVGRSKLKSLGQHLDDKRNTMYKQFLRFLYEIKPKAFVMENVPGILTHDKGNTLNRILRHFKGLGYNVSPHLLKASDFGVPQTRKRVFFVGFRKDLSLSDLKPFSFQVTAGDALLDLPSLRAGEGSEYASYSSQPKTDYQRLMRKNSLGVYNHHARAYSPMDIKIFSLMTQGMKYYQIPNHLKRYRDDSFRDKYKRLISAQPSWTVVAHLQKDGYMFIHPTQDRTITVREAARLQSFPDRFIFYGPMTRQFRQVGNAVPPFLARAIGIAVRKTLQKAKISVRPILRY